MGVRVEMPSNQPIVLLREVTGERYLPIWIGAVEATAIAFAQQGVVPPRPLTHDLMKDVLEATGNELAEVRIVVSGAGAAGTAIVTLLLAAGAKDVVVVDREGALAAGDESLSAAHAELAAATRALR